MKNKVIYKKIIVMITLAMMLFNTSSSSVFATVALAEGLLGTETTENTGPGEVKEETETNTVDEISEETESNNLEENVSEEDIEEGAAASPTGKNLPDVKLHAENAKVDQATAKTLLTEEDLRTVNKATGTINGTATEPIVEITTTSWDAIKAGTVGVYGVTYKVISQEDHYVSSAPVGITVVEDGSVISGTTHVYAEDATIDQSEAKTVLTYADLERVNKATGSFYGPSAGTVNIDIESADFDAIQAGTEGSYEVTYSLGAGTTADDHVEKKVKINVVKDGSVISPDGKNAVYAEDATVDQATAKTLLTDGDLRTVNQVKGTSNGTATEPKVTIATTDRNAIKAGKEGSYEVTYTLGTASGNDYAEKKVKINVVKDGSVISPDGKNVVYAEDATVDQATAKTLLTDAALRTVNKATGTTDGEATEPKVTIATTDWNAIKAGTEGSYEVTYSLGTTVTNGYAEKKVKINVVKDGSIISPDGKNAVYAEDATVDQATAKTLLTDAALRTVNKVKGTSNGTATEPKVTIATTDWNAIKAGTEGSYEVTYSLGTASSNDYAEKKVKINVVKDGSVISPDGANSVYAENAVVDKAAAKLLVDEAKLREVNKVSATSNGEVAEAKVTIATTDWDAIKAGTGGSYDVTYSLGTESTNDYAVATVKITVIPDGSVISPDGKNSVYAENAVVNETEAQLLVDEASLREVNKVIATIDGALAEAKGTITSTDWDAIKAGTVGSYDVTYSVGTAATGTYAEKTVKIVVLKNGTVGGPDSPYLTATNKVFEKTDVVDEAALLSEVTAYDTKDGDLTDQVRIKSSNVVSGTPGIYRVTYTVKDSGNLSTDKTVSVLIKDDTTVGGEDGAPYLTADNKVFEKTDTVDNAALLAGVTAFDEEDGELTGQVAIKSSDVVSGTPGIYSVTYTVKDSDNLSTDKTITVMIKDTTTVGGLDSPYITASNKVFEKTDVVDEAALLAGVTAFDTKDGNLTSMLEVKSSDVESGTPGIYNVIYTVKDSDGLSTDKSILVFIRDGGNTGGGQDGASYINAYNKVFEKTDVVDDAALLVDVTAFDTEDGDLTSEVVVKSLGAMTKAFNVSGQTGVYEVTYQVTDSAGHITESTKNFIIKDDTTVGGENGSPYLTAYNKNFEETDVVDEAALLGGVRAFDMEDGDLTNAVSIKSTDIESGVPGIYHVTYAVTDSDGNTTQTTVQVLIMDEDTVGGEDGAPYITAHNKVYEQTDVVDEAALLVDVTAFDLKDGDLTGSISIKSSNVISGTPGIYQVVYTVTDSDNKTTESTIEVMIKDDDTVGGADGAPFITAHSKVFDEAEVVTDATLLEDVTAFDVEDGNLTDSVTIKSSDVVSGAPGVYSVTYTVTDSDGNTTDTTFAIYIKGKDTVGTSPYLTAGNKVYESTDIVDDAALMQDVNALDMEDGNLTDQVVIKSSNVISGQPGNYSVTYMVEDSEGNEVEKTVSVVINGMGLPIAPKPEIAAPVKPQTGDTNRGMIYTLVTLASVMGLVTLKRRKSEMEK